MEFVEESNQLYQPKLTIWDSVLNHWSLVNRDERFDETEAIRANGR